jgi:GTPase SAR1 family protein
MTPGLPRRRRRGKVPAQRANNLPGPIVFKVGPSLSITPPDRKLMSPRQKKAHLDALERRLTGPKRIALFGHRAVGKTTLLAMFYREASTGRVPGIRMASSKPSTAEYLADKIAQIESGEPLAGTLVETELHLRLYHGPARFDLIVKDYQGEHASLGSDAPIRAFFVDCDAVFLCLDPEGTAAPTDRRRRQQEVEELLERYIEASDDGSAGRPVALLVTKYDRVLAQGGPPADQVERLVDDRYGMTRHALAAHAPRSALFGVSSYGRGGSDGRPPVELHPMGLEGPLVWLADQLEAIDREQLEWIWDLAPTDLPRLSRCVKAFERRYPRSDAVIDLRRRLGGLRRHRLRLRCAGLAVAAGAFLVGLAGYDAWGYRAAVHFERGHAPTLVERRWQEFLTWHPSLPLFWPSWERGAQARLREWTIKAEAQRIAVGTAAPSAPEALARLRDEAPELLPQIERVEQARQRRRHDEQWKALQAGDLAAADQPEDRLAAYRAFLKDFPDTPNRSEALELVSRWGARVADRREQSERREVDALQLDASLPDPDWHALVEKSRLFLERHSESAWRDEVEALLADATRHIDEADIRKARDFSRSFPTNFPTRLRKYQEYLAAHENGGRFVREALDAIDQIDRERDRYAYRQAHDHAVAHSDDVAEVARRLRSYLDANPAGRYAGAAKEYLAWWDKVTVPGQYRVVLKRGEVEPDIGKYLNGGGPDLAVEIWVAGVKYGPTPVAPNTRTPIWNYTFPRPITWKYGDPVVIRILDMDWSDSGVFRLTGAKGDPLAMRLLSGEVKPAKGGRTKLVFASDFRIPPLPRPE